MNVTKAGPVAPMVKTINVSCCGVFWKVILGGPRKHLGDNIKMSSEETDCKDTY
jgi:hypothetical protein